MSFINFALLGGLGVIAVPIIIHLLNRRTPKVLDWGAMRFLVESLESRKKRIQLEEALLLASRCLLAGLIALTVARPFIPPGSGVPWVVVLPAFLLGLTAFTTALVLRGNRKWFWLVMGAAALLAVVSVVAVAFERYWNLKRLGSAGGKDIAIILDSSTSMGLRGTGGATVFETAVAEARQIVEKAPPGSAFSLISGGPVPVPLLPDPVLNRSDVLEALAAAAPSRGKMAAFDALAAATVSLSRGSAHAKEIVVLTDGQNIGWEVDKRERWDALAKSMETLPAKPEVILRRFPLPSPFRNAAVTDIRYSREVIGTDRPVFIEVTVENTGTEAVTPSGLTLAAGDKVLTDPGTGQLAPGSRRTVRFEHRFPRAGNVVVKAALQVEDDLPADDTSESVCRVADRLGVLIADGNGNGRFLERAGAFAALALAPPVIRGGAAKGAEKKGEEEKAAVMVDPEVVPLTRLASVESLQSYGVIILADAPRLPDSLARRLAGWVQSGGGLLVTPGTRALPEFYNNWRDAEGELFLPAALVSEEIPKEPASLDPRSFVSESLRALAEPGRGDLGGAVFSRYWKLNTDGRTGAHAAAKLGNGEPFLAGRRAGLGMILQACVNFDTAGGNLPTRQTFVPLVHQLVYQLASPGGQPMNLAPTARLILPLSAGPAAGGLKGEYFKGNQTKVPALVRIDGKPDFNWGDKSPGPGVPPDFSAVWTGALLPRYTEEYTFDGWGDDSLALWIGGERLFERGGEARMKLEAGRHYPIKLEFRDGNGGAALQLFWRSQSQRHEIIPEDCLIPFAPGGEEMESPAGTLEVAGPDNRPRKADLVFSRAGLSARIGGNVIPGLYRVKVPEDRAASFHGMLAEDGSIPFTVAGDAAESRLSPLDAAALDFLREKLTLLEPDSAAKVIDILSGREFGEELWRYLAAGALLILLAETALARWIALSRRSGESETVDFEHRFEPSAAFQQALNRARSEG